MTGMESDLLFAHNFLKSIFKKCLNCLAVYISFVLKLIIKISFNYLEQWPPPTFLAPGTQFHGRQVVHRQDKGGRGVEGGSGVM